MSASICQGQSISLPWGLVVNTGGTYTNTLQNSMGCDSAIIAVTVTVNGNAQVVNTNPVICAGNNFTLPWGTVVTNAGFYTDTLQSAGGCDSLIRNVTLTVQNASVINQNRSICAGSNFTLPSGNIVNAPGTYRDTLHYPSGCDSLINIIDLVVQTAIDSIVNAEICGGQSYTLPSGAVVTTANTYRDTTRYSSGCDSIRFAVNLIVHNTAGAVSDVTVCENLLPYSWNGQNYSAPGSFVRTLTGQSGCDSIVTLNLQVNRNTTSTTDRSICTSQLPFNWNGNTYNSAGTYQVVLVNSAGCDSLATLNLQVTTSTGSVTDTSVCPSQLPFNWNGNAYASPGSYQVTLTGSAGCDSIASLNLSVLATTSSDTDVTVCENLLPYLWNGNSYTAPGSYSVQLTGINGCDSTANLNLFVNRRTSSITNEQVCNNALPYLWNGNSYSSAGSFTVTLVNAAGCDSTAVLNLSVEPGSSGTANVSICDAQLPYSWNGNLYNAAGTFSVLLTGSNGCDSTATLNLSVNSITASTTNVAVCSSQLPYTWNGNNYSAAGSFAVTLVNSNGCDSLATLNLLVNMDGSSTSSVNICASQLPYLWNGNTFTGSGSYMVNLSTTAGCDSVAVLDLHVYDIPPSTSNVSVCAGLLPYTWNGNTYTSAGTYTVTLVSASGCDSLATLVLNVIAPTQSNSNITVCPAQLPYSWNGSVFTGAGTYPVTLVSASGCDSTAVLTLSVSAVLTSTTNLSVCSAQFPFTWNGSALPAPGVYQANLLNSAGCDSIATLNLSLSPALASTTNTLICPSQLPYSWNGNTITSAGTYQANLVNANGCDSIATLVLGLKPVSTSTTNITRCPSQMPFNWNGNTYTSAGLYQVNLTGSDGCDSTAILNLSVSAVLTGSETVSVCPSQLPYSWNGNTYSSAGSYPVTLTGSGVCDSIATLILVVKSISTSSTSVTICNSQLPYSWNGNVYNTAGSYTVALTGSNGCDSLATLILTTTTVINSNTNISVCENQLPYLWNGNSYTSAGTFRVTLTSSGGCDSIANLVLNVLPFRRSVTNLSTCSDQLPFNWNGQSYTATGSYVVTLVAANGCDSLATLNLLVNNTPGAPSVSPVQYCGGEAATALSAITTTPGATLRWYNVPTGGTASTVAPVPSTTAAGTFNYYVSQVKDNCEGLRSRLTVTIHPKPSLGIDKEIDLCYGQVANLTGLYNTMGMQSSWTLQQQPVADPTRVQVSGDYRLIITSTDGCSDSAVVKLEIYPKVVANAGEDAIVEYNVNYQLQGSGGGIYQWSPPALLNNAGIARPTTRLLDDQEFILKVTNDIGCSGYDTVNLKVLKGPGFYVPTAFTPNGDGKNDVFRPTPVGIKKLEYFRVFNRYGELVFETSDIYKGWDGMYKGRPQNIGNFIWTLKGTDRDNKERLMNGYVVLIR